MILRPVSEIDEQLADRGYRLHPDYDTELWHIIAVTDDGGRCVGVVPQPDRALVALAAAGWPTCPVLGWRCPTHEPEASPAA